MQLSAPLPPPKKSQSINNNMLGFYKHQIEGIHLVLYLPETGLVSLRGENIHWSSPGSSFLAPVYKNFLVLPEIIGRG